MTVNKPSEYQQKFGDRPLMLGSVRAYRVFKTTTTLLTPASEAEFGLRGSWHGRWVDGENVAVCAVNRFQTTPLTEKPTCNGTDLLACTCGFYGQWELPEQLDIIPPEILGVVEHYGETLVGERGVRSRKARIISILDMRPTNHKIKQLTELYPSVEIYRWDEDRLIDWVDRSGVEMPK